MSDGTYSWMADIICEVGTLLFEFIGAIILLKSGIVGIYNYIRKNLHIPGLRLVE